MDLSLTLPLDGAFLRRQCPSCDAQFKWHHGPTDDRPPAFVDPAMYHCPYCGYTAAPNEWLTTDQRDYALGVAAGPALGHVTDELSRIASKRSRGLLRMSVKTMVMPEAPSPLVEPSDMLIVTSPCHPWEPVKIVEDWRRPIHCLVCGTLFAV